jgi:predicted TIM-barrel fold metal-dependent hydrolase
VLVIDTHTHIGKSENSDFEISVDLLLRTMDRYGVDVSLVMPLPSVADFRSQHDLVAEACRAHPKRVFGVAQIPTHIGPDAYREEARRCIEDLGFVAFKFHTYHHGGPPLSAKGIMALDAAREFRLPLMVHTGPGAPWALPSMMIPAARKYPEVTLICAHSGMEIYADDAVVAAAECSNIILETSWTSPGKVLGFFRRFGADRVIMASDLPSNIAIQRAVFESIDLTAEQRYISLCSLPVKMFKLESKLSGWQDLRRDVWAGV